MGTEVETRAIAIFKQHGGILHTRQAMDLGIHPRILYRLRDTGELVHVSRGVYRLASLPRIGNPDLVVVATRIPKAVVCLVSALAYHDITSEVPHEMHIALPRGTKTPRIGYPPIRTYRFSGPALTEGVEVVEIDGVPVKVYGPAKTVVDAFRFRNKLGIDVAVEALQFCIKHKGARSADILHYARLCRLERVMQPYLEGATPVKKRKLTNVAASVHDRLLARAKAEDKPFHELLQYYAIERFLFRLSRSKHADRFVLKGALMHQLWGGSLSRSTRDIDLMGRIFSSVDQEVDNFRDCLSVKVDDDRLRSGTRSPGSIEKSDG